MNEHLLIPQQQRVLDVLKARPQTWDELRALTKLNDDQLGSTILALLNLRLIWTREKNGTRFYALERRVGLVPRFQAERRASERREVPA